MFLGIRLMMRRVSCKAQEAPHVRPLCFWQATAESDGGLRLLMNAGPEALLSAGRRLQTVDFPLRLPKCCAANPVPMHSRQRFKPAALVS